MTATIPNTRGLRLLAWVPLLFAVGLGLYLAIAAPTGVGAPATFMRDALEVALHGHISLVVVLAPLAGLVSIGCAVPFVIHMAEDPTLTRKGAWIAGGIFLASIVLPIYAVKRLRPAAA